MKRQLGVGWQLWRLIIVQEIMKDLKNSCGGNGCNIRIILPHDGGGTDVYPRMHERMHGIISLQKVVAKAA